MDESEKDFDPSYLRDLVDIIKNKTLFFIPFFGALLAFLLTKSDFVKNSNFVIWGLLAVLLASCVRYISLVSDLLWVMESLRFVFTIRKSGVEEWPTWAEDRKSATELLKLVPKLIALENWWYRRVMSMMYFALFLVLFDIFFGKAVSDFISMLVARVLQ